MPMARRASSSPVLASRWARSDRVADLRVCAALAGEQPGSLQVQDQAGQRVGEHVVHVAGEPLALGQRGGLGLRGPGLPSPTGFQRNMDPEMLRTRLAGHEFAENEVPPGLENTVARRGYLRAPWRPCRPTGESLPRGVNSAVVRSERAAAAVPGSWEDKVPRSELWVPRIPSTALTSRVAFPAA
jgi:hypothetical protein